MRQIDHIKYYKATEFRTICLYTGMVIFKDLLQEEVYTHFLKFCLAVRLCSCEAYVSKKNMKALARTLFNEFCESYIIIYGEDSVVSNIHHVSHIMDDVERFGSLNTISTYPFENYLREIKSRVAASKQPIAQIAGRIAEISLDWNNHIDVKDLKAKRANWVPELKHEFNCKSFKSLNLTTFHTIQITPKICLSSKKFGDKWFITESNEIVEMKFGTQIDDSFYIYGSRIKNKCNFFIKPYSSSLTNIYQSNGDKTNEEFFDVSDIKAKMMCLSYQEDLVFIPILHSIDERLQLIK